MHHCLSNWRITEKYFTFSGQVLFSLPNLISMQIEGHSLSCLLTYICPMYIYFTLGGTTPPVPSTCGTLHLFSYHNITRVINSVVNTAPQLHHGSLSCVVLVGWGGTFGRDRTMTLWLAKGHSLLPDKSLRSPLYPVDVVADTIVCTCGGQQRVQS